MTFRAVNIFKAIELRLNRRSVAFLFCLILSGLFWLLTSLSKEYVDRVVLSVEYQGLPEDLLIVNDPVTAVEAQVQGFGFDLLWNWFNTRSLKLVVDATPAILPSLTRLGDDWHYFLPNAKNSRASQMADEQLQLLNVSPDTIFLLFRPKHTKSVPVRLDATFSFRKQFGLRSEPVLQPDSVVLSGPKEELDSIQFVSTEPQRFSDLSESLTAEVPLRSVSSNGKVVLDRAMVQLEVNVVEYTEGTVTVPVKVSNENGRSVQLFPPEVELKYLVPLPDFDKVNASQFDVSVTVNSDSERSSRLVVQVDRYPSELKQVRAFPPQVEFIIQK